jgi:nucleoporin POM34
MRLPKWPFCVLCSTFPLPSQRLLQRSNLNDRNQMVSFKNSIPYSYYLLWLIRFVFLANIGVAIWPLVLRYHPDDVADIPLTPSQRLAMGLDPDVETPQTPGSAYASPNYVTPPRYQKSTPRSGFGTSGDRRSPLTGSPRTGLGMSSSNSPFPPSSGSPLFQKVLNGSATKRMGYDSRDSPLSGSSLFMDSGSSNAPSTPTPAGGKASVGLNNKWLYEKRRDSRGSSLFS